MLYSAPRSGAMLGLRWMLFGVLALGVLSLQAARGTLAFFTSTATSTANAFTAGTVSLQVADANETAASTVAGSVGSAALAPGDTISGYIDVTNAGSLPFRYALATTDTTVASTANTAVSNALTVAVDTRAAGTTCTASAGGTGQTAVVAAGAALKTLAVGDSAQGAQTGDRTLASSAGERLCLYVAFPFATGNTAQGGTASYTFTLAAEQTANNP